MKRSLLFMPGGTPNLLINAAVLGADAAIFDLEDAVSPDEKDAARILVRNTLRYLDLGGMETIVRINAIDTPYWQADLDQVLPENPNFIMIPKSETPEGIQTMDAYMTQKLGPSSDHPVGIIALIETALGLENAYHIATASPRVTALFLGAEDLTADLRCKRTKEGREIDYARGRMVAAARAAGIDVYDTPFTDVNDDEGMAVDAAYAKALGFTGKASISPRHVSIINQTFSPSAADIQYAYEVMDAIARAKELGKGAIALRGKMIDAPIVARAQQTIQMAEAMGLSREGGTRP